MYCNTKVGTLPLLYRDISFTNFYKLTTINENDIFVINFLYNCSI